MAGRTFAAWMKGHASLVRSLGMPGVTNVRLVPTAEGADRSRWMPDSESYVSPDGRLKLVLGKPGEVRIGLGVWTEARLFEDGAERTRRPIGFKAIRAPHCSLSPSRNSADPKIRGQVGRSGG